MKKNYQFLSIFMLLCGLMLTSAGCGSDTENNAGSSGNQAAQKPLSNQTDSTDNAEVSSMTTERRILADRICRSIEKLEGVEDASVLIADADGKSSYVNNNRAGSAGSENSLNNSHASNATNTTGSGKTSVTNGNINNTNGSTNGSSSSANSSGNSNSSGNYGSNPSGSNNNEGNGSSADGTSINAAGPNADAPYVAIVAVTPTQSIQNDDMKLNALASSIRQLILQDENTIQEVIVTSDQRDIQNIGNLANNMLKDSSRDSRDEINRLRDELTSAGKNLVNSGRNMADDVADGLKDLAN